MTCCPRTQSPRVLSLLQHAALSHLHYPPDNCLQPVMSASCPAKHALYNFPFLPLSLWFSRENMSVFSLFVFLLTDERERESNIGVWAGWGWPPGKQGWITGPVAINVNTWQMGSDCLSHLSITRLYKEVGDRRECSVLGSGEPATATPS